MAADTGFIIGFPLPCRVRSIAHGLLRGGAVNDAMADMAGGAGYPLAPQFRAKFRVGCEDWIKPVAIMETQYPEFLLPVERGVAVQADLLVAFKAMIRAKIRIGPGTTMYAGSPFAVDRTVAGAAGGRAQAGQGWWNFAACQGVFEMPGDGENMQWP